MRDTFVRTIITLAKQDPEIVLITGDLGFGVLKSYWEAIPEQFINAGISEQNMASLAAGLAMEGKKVIIYSIGNFPTLRCLEQIRNDCAYHEANVKVVCVGGGFVYGSLGMSHHATEDIAIMRALPGVTVLCPGDLVEAEEATRAMMKYHGVCYLRLGRGGEKKIHEEKIDFSIGHAIEVHKDEEKKIAIFSTGAIFEEVQGAYETLCNMGYHPSIYTFPTVKPIDEKVIRECAEQFELIATCEEHNLSGGFGSAIAEKMAEMARKKAMLLRIGLQDTYCSKVGNQNYLRHEYEIDNENIVKKIISKLM